MTQNENIKLNYKQNLQTILIITVGFVALYIYFRIDIYLYISLVIGLIGIVSDYLTDKVVWVWNKISWLLSKIVPNILLSIIFYLILYPISILSKIFGEKDTLNLKNTKNTLFIETNKEFNKIDFEKPY